MTSQLHSKPILVVGYICYKFHPVVRFRKNTNEYICPILLCFYALIRALPLLNYFTIIKIKIIIIKLRINMDEDLSFQKNVPNF